MFKTPLIQSIGESLNSSLFSGFGDTILLSLDFVNGSYSQGSETSLDNILNFSRSGSATYWNSSGALKTATTDELRFNYDPSDNSFKGVLIEESRTNEVLDNRDLSTANWSGSATAAKNETGIDGVSNTATTVTDDDGSAIEDLYQNITVTDDSKTHAVSFFVKKTTSASVLPMLRAYLSGGTTELKYSLILDTDDGNTTAKGDASSSDYEVLDFGDWWRVVFFAANNGTGNTTLAPVIFPAYTGAGLAGSADSSSTNSIIVDHVQVELDRSEASSPIETGSSAVTRPADVPYITVNSVSEGTIVVSVTPTARKDISGIRATVFDLSDGTSSERVLYHCYIESPSTATFKGDTAEKDLSGNPDPDKIAISWKNDKCSLSEDGEATSGDSGTVGKFTTMNRLDLGYSSYSSSGRSLTHIKSITLYSDFHVLADLTELSS